MSKIPQGYISVQGSIHTPRRDKIPSTAYKEF